MPDLGQNQAPFSVAPTVRQVTTGAAQDGSLKVDRGHRLPGSYSRLPANRVLSAAPEFHFGLRWYYKGMMSLQETGGDRIDAFVSFWVSIITIVRAWHAQNIGGDPPETRRFRDFASNHMGLENEDLETLVGKFHDIVCNRRNELFKGGGGMVVTQDEIIEAATIAHQVLSVSRP